MESFQTPPRSDVERTAVILVLRFGKLTDTANHMRMIGQLENEASARLFSNFLYAQGIENQTEPERTGAWALWIHAEEQMDAAKALLNEYRENPRDPKYQQASRVAEEKWKQEQKANADAEKRFHDRSKLFSLGGLEVGFLTGVLIAISVATALFSSLGHNTKPISWLFFSEYDVEGGLIARFSGLPEIRHGEVWRLFTPMFVHFGPMHVFFNMLWLLDLGTMIERRQSARALLALVLVIAPLSNFGQYLWQGPIFGGMSGVVYGLIGYIWLRGKFDLTSGLFLHRNTVMMAVIWFLLCLAGVIPHVANAAHSVGFGVGIAWGFISAMIATRRH
jgi:GlpG protein